MMNAAKSENSSLRLWEEWRQNRPLSTLYLKTAFFGGGAVLAAMGDIGGVLFALRQRYLDVQGNFSGSTVELLAVSCMTLFGYLGISLLAKHGFKKAAMGVYLGILFLIALSLWPTEVPRFEEVWNSGPSTGGNVFSDPSSAGVASGGAPIWFLVVCDTVFAFGFTLAGLLFLYFKEKLAECAEEWGVQTKATKVFDTERRTRAQQSQIRQRAADLAKLDSEDSRSRIANRAVGSALKEHTKALLAGRSKAEAKAKDVLRTAAERESAQAMIERVPQCLMAVERAMMINPLKKGAKTTVMGLLLVGFLLSEPLRAQGTAELCRMAPVMQLLVDASGSSPARDPGFINSVLPLVDQQLRAMPACSQILIVTVGDASTMPVMLRTRIQLRTTRDGATVDDISRGVHQFLDSVPKRIQSHAQGRSELIGGFADAAANVNSQSRGPNVIVVLSDMVEHSRFADCETRTCRLPAPKFSLSNVIVTVYGAGLGLPSTRALALTREWDNWLAKAGAKSALHRTF